MAKLSAPAISSPKTYKMRQILILAVAHAFAFILSACSMTQVDAVLDPGTNKLVALHVSSTNFITDRALTATRGLDGTFGIGYNTNPNETGQAAAFAAITKALEKIPPPP